MVEGSIELWHSLIRSTEGARSLLAIRQRRNPYADSLVTVTTECSKPLGTARRRSEHALGGVHGTTVMGGAVGGVWRRM